MLSQFWTIYINIWIEKLNNPDKLSLLWVQTDTLASVGLRESMIKIVLKVECGRGLDWFYDILPSCDPIL